MDAHQKKAAVVGWPISHSLSPSIHNLWARRTGLNAQYLPIAIPPTYEDFAAKLDELQAAGFAGINITLPHKENALRYAAKASNGAEKAGAANMITFGCGGPYADNSDVEGFAQAVKGIVSKEKINSALVIGAGGAARGVVLAFQSLGVKDITLTNRTKDKALAIANDFKTATIDWGKEQNIIDTVDMIVNTTSLGMTGQPPLDLDLSRLQHHAIVADIVYSPLETPLLKSAKQKGNATVDGLAMLMHQAVPGFRQWFGGEPIVDQELRNHLVTILNNRKNEC
ncbi:MAG: shikimate dehydrogenase (NADP(+)) [Hyphococcus sp.]|nr:MAG: shikimate dehydrogenase (NADP(+)) [Marinicaulis sp.]